MSRSPAPEAAPRPVGRPEPTAAIEPLLRSDRLATLGLEPLATLDDLAASLSVSRSSIERMKSAGKLPRPDLHIGRMPRWRPETVRRWIDGQSTRKGVCS